MNIYIKFFLSVVLVGFYTLSVDAQSRKSKKNSATEEVKNNEEAKSMGASAPITEEVKLEEPKTNKSVSDGGLKLGHINTQEILSEMPQVLEMQKKIEKLGADFETESNTMRADYETKMKEYEQNVQRWTEPMKRNKEKAIIELGKRIEEFEADAQQSLKTSRDSLLNPILKQVSTAIEDVAKENNYNYIFDVSVGVLLYFDKGDDISAFVRKKLNIPATKPSTPAITPTNR